MPVQSYLWLEGDQLDAPAVDFEDLLLLGRVVLIIRHRPHRDGSISLLLDIRVSAEYRYKEGVEPTPLQFLHVHTKLASPLLPLISCSSYAQC